MKHALVLCALVCAASCRATPAQDLPNMGVFDIEHFEASLDLSPLDKNRVRIEGDVTLSGVANGVERVSLDAVAFESVDVTSTPPARWSYDGQQIQGQWPDAVTAPISISIRYRTQPDKGIQREGQEVWTSFHTWHWMPVSKAPSERATLALDVRAPEGWTVIATGDGPHRPGPDIVSKVPHPSYTYGFYAGMAQDRHTLEGLDVWGAPKDAAKLVLTRTQAAMNRWESRFQTPLAAHYVQVFVPGRAAQELAGMAFMSRAYLKALEKDPNEDWLVVHELAHQAWGNRVTCATWGDFWLNEAIVVWWVARDKQLRGQHEAYEREIDLWRARTEKARARGDDPRIQRPGVGVEDAGGSIVYHSGALLIAALARHIGVETLERAMAGWIDSAQKRGTSLSTAAFLDSLPLSPALRTHAECALQGRECAVP